MVRAEEVKRGSESFNDSADIGGSRQSEGEYRPSI